MLLSATGSLIRRLLTLPAANLVQGRRHHAEYLYIRRELHAVALPDKKQPRFTTLEGPVYPAGDALIDNLRL